MGWGNSAKRDSPAHKVAARSAGALSDEAIRRANPRRVRVLLLPLERLDHRCRGEGDALEGAREARLRLAIVDAPPRIGAEGPRVAAVQCGVEPG